MLWHLPLFARTEAPDRHMLCVFHFLLVTMPLLHVFYFYFHTCFIPFPQSAVNTVLLTRYLHRAIYIRFPCNINTATLDVCRLAFAISTSIIDPPSSLP